MEVPTWLAVVVWFVLNMTIANLNKFIFKRHDLQYAALLTLLHMLACWALSYLSLRLSTGAAPRQLSRGARTGCLWLSVVFVVSVASGNAALRFVHISFAQTIGATAPLWTVLLSVAITRKAYALRVYLALGLVCLGMGLATTGEVNFHLYGFALALLATLTRALKSILQGMLLSAAPAEKLDSTELLYHMSRRASLWLAGWVLALEREAFTDAALRDAGLWRLLAVSSLVAFALNVRGQTPLPAHMTIVSVLSPSRAEAHRDPHGGRWPTSW